MIGDPNQPKIEHGSSTRTDGAWYRVFNGNQSSQWHFYAISEPLTLQAIPTFSAVTAITRKDANPSNAASVRWDVTFDGPVTGLTAGNFSLVETGISGSAITDVSGSGTDWVVTASHTGGCGTLGLDLTDATGIAPPLTNAPFTGEVYDIDTVDPEIECARDIVVSIQSGGTTDPINYETMASDACSGLESLGFSPPSGSTFGVGVHGVTATATDNAGNEATATFNVVVLVIAETPGGRFVDAAAVSGDAAAGPGADRLQIAYAPVCEAHCGAVAAAQDALSAATDEPARAAARAELARLERVCSEATRAHLQAVAALMEPAQAARFLALMEPRVNHSAGRAGAPALDAAP
jgi:hypothetical protein